MYTVYDLPEPSFDSSGMPPAFSNAQCYTDTEARMPAVAPSDFPAAQFDDPLFELGLVSSFVDPKPGYSQPDTSCSTWRAMVQEGPPLNIEETPDAHEQFQMASSSQGEPPEKSSNGLNQQSSGSRPSVNCVDELSLLVPFPVTGSQNFIHLNCLLHPTPQDAQESTSSGKECKDSANRKASDKFEIDG